jgi:hypothetical protein
MQTADRVQDGDAPGGVSRVVGHAYPWDVIGDPAFGDRVRALGIREVTVAASYHSARAATPLHPRHRVLEAPHAALYRPVRAEVWAGRSLRPVAGDWVTDGEETGGPDSSWDPFAQAAGTLLGQGFEVNAWLVLAHSTRLGTLRPDLAVRNCFGDSYSYALCIAHEEVRDYVATLAAEATRDVPVNGVSIEGLGQMGVAHNGPHEKTDGAFGSAAQRVLSVCCCTACRIAWGEKGLDPHQTIARLREALAAAQNGNPAAGMSMPDLLGDTAEQLLATRLAHQDSTRRRVLAALRGTAPHTRLTLHGQADPWATGPSPAVTATAAGDVDAILVPAWGINETSSDAIAAARRMAPSSVSIAAYVSVLPPTELSAVPAHVAALVRSGADELHLYHLGLATRRQLDMLGTVAGSAQ